MATECQVGEFPYDAILGRSERSFPLLCSNRQVKNQGHRKQPHALASCENYRISNLKHLTTVSIVEEP